MKYNVDLIKNIIKFVENIKSNELRESVKQYLEYSFNIKSTIVDDIEMYNEVYDTLNKYKNKNISLPSSMHLNSLICAMNGSLSSLNNIDEKYYNDLITFIDGISIINLCNVKFEIFLGIKKKYIKIYNTLTNNEYNKIKENDTLKFNLLTMNNNIKYYYITLK